MKARLFTDGGARGNPGPAAYAYVLEDEHGDLLAAHGEAIGFINSARIAAAFLGPVIATSLLAWTPAPVLYACLGAVGAACVPVGWRMRA